MTSLHKLSVVGALTGLIVFLVSIYRYFVYYNDPSQGIIGIMCGVIIIGGAYLYNLIREQEVFNNKVEARINAIVSKYFHTEEEDTNAVARGENIEL